LTKKLTKAKSSILTEIFSKIQNVRLAIKSASIFATLGAEE